MVRVLIVRLRLVIGVIVRLSVQGGNCKSMPYANVCVCVCVDICCISAPILYLIRKQQGFVSGTCVSFFLHIWSNE